MLWKIAFRNILRHKRRTVFSALTIMVGMMFFIFMDSLLTGMDRGAIDNMINLSAASLKIRTPAYMEDQKALPLKYGVENTGAIQQALSKFDRVNGVAPRTSFLGQLSIYTETMPVQGIVIDAAADSSVFNLGKYTEGKSFSGDNKREIVLGKKLAEDLKLHVGDWVTLYALTRFDSRNADDFQIVGLINSTDPSINRSTIYITYEAANDFLDLDGLVTEVNVGLHRRTNLSEMQRDAGHIAAGMKSQFPELRTQTFMEIAADFLEIAKTKRAFGYVFLLVIMLIASIGIFNTVLMSIYERIREVGVMRAFGFTPRQLTTLFILEGFITGIFGAFLGIAAGLVVNAILVFHGYPLDMFGEMGDFPIWGTIYGEWNIGTYVIIFVFCVLTATLAGLIPARKAGKMEITQALRFL